MARGTQYNKEKSIIKSVFKLTYDNKCKQLLAFICMSKLDECPYIFKLFAW